MNTPQDIINHFAATAPGSPLDVLRDARPDAKLHAQKAFQALFMPEHPGDVSLTERFALGLFTTTLHRAGDLAVFYGQGLKDAGAPAELIAAVNKAAAENLTMGPYGAYPEGPLSVEDVSGPLFSVSDALAAALGARLTAALGHAHMLVFHPRDANADAIQKLFDAGWSEDGVVTISQLITFLAYQVRLVHGLRVLAATMEGAQ